MIWNLLSWKSIRRFLITKHCLRLYIMVQFYSNSFFYVSDHHSLIVRLNVFQTISKIWKLSLSLKSFTTRFKICFFTYTHFLKFAKTLQDIHSWSINFSITQNIPEHQSVCVMSMKNTLLLLADRFVLKICQRPKDTSIVQHKLRTPLF